MYEIGRGGCEHAGSVNIVYDADNLSGGSAGDLERLVLMIISISKLAGALDKYAEVVRWLTAGA